MKKTARVIRRESIASGRFIALEKVHFEDESARERTWEAASRVGSTGAVMIFACIEPEDQLILVRQFRPPVGKYVIEFPAGLVDPGESIENTAVRELREETGYAGEVIRTLPRAYSSPGMSGEWIAQVFIRVNGDDYAEAPETFQEDSECIETLRIPRKDLGTFCNEAISRGDGVDAKVLCYAAALTEA